MRIICIGTLKGGVGKSMGAFNIAGILAEQGYKVLAIDVDPQGNLTNNLGIDRTADNYMSTKDIFENKTEFSKVVIKAPIKQLSSLDVLGSSIFLSGTDLRLVGLSARENILRNYLEDNLESFNYYDFVIIDTNPSMSIINQNAFVISDSIILFSDVSMNSIEGTQLFIALWDDIRKNLRLQDNVKGFIINNYDVRIKLSKDFIEYCKDDEDISKIMFNTIIPANVRLKESELEALPINLYDKNCKGYEAFINIVEEMKVRGII